MQRPDVCGIETPMLHVRKQIQTRLVCITGEVEILYTVTVVSEHDALSPSSRDIATGRWRKVLDASAQAAAFSPRGIDPWR